MNQICSELGGRASNVAFQADEIAIPRNQFADILRLNNQLQSVVNDQ
jgi:hypothetical protein